MVSRETYEDTCIFCGKTRIITITTDDHVDYEGRNWIPSETRSNDNGCDCKFGQLAFEKTKIKPMCHNCKFNEFKYCVNENELSEISTMFDVGKKINIKTPTRNCKYYQLNTAIFLELLS